MLWVERYTVPKAPPGGDFDLLACLCGLWLVVVAAARAAAARPCGNMVPAYFQKEVALFRFA